MWLFGTVYCFHYHDSYNSVISLTPGLLYIQFTVQIYLSKIAFDPPVRRLVCQKIDINCSVKRRNVNNNKLPIEDHMHGLSIVFHPLLAESGMTHLALGPWFDKLSVLFNAVMSIYSYMSVDAYLIEHGMPYMIDISFLLMYICIHCYILDRA